MAARIDPAGVGAVVFAAVVWGTTGTAARFAPEVGPLAIGAAAMGIGGLCQALIAQAAIRAAWAGLRGQLALWLVGALAVAVYPLAFYSAMQASGVTIGTVVSLGSAPLIAGAMEWGLEGRRPSRRWALSAALGLAGLVVLAQAKGGGAATASASASATPTATATAAVTAGPAPEWGMVLGLVAGGSYALYSWTARRMMLAGVPPGAAMGATFGLGGVLLLPVLALTGAAFLQSAGNLLTGLYMALVPMTLGYLAFGRGLARLPASLATTLTLLEPVVAALLAAGLLGEVLSGTGWAGVALVGAGAALLAWPGGASKAGRESSPDPFRPLS